MHQQDITLALGCEVNRIDRAAGDWLVETSSGQIRTAAVVLSTGKYRTPAIPPWPGLDQFAGELARLDQVRATYDPDGMFHSSMGRG